MAWSDSGHPSITVNFGRQSSFKKSVRRITRSQRFDILRDFHDAFHRRKAPSQTAGKSSSWLSRLFGHPRYLIVRFLVVCFTNVWLTNCESCQPILMGVIPVDMVDLVFSGRSLRIQIPVLSWHVIWSQVWHETHVVQIVQGVKHWVANALVMTSSRFTETSQAADGLTSPLTYFFISQGCAISDHRWWQHLSSQYRSRYEFLVGVFSNRWSRNDLHA